MPKMEQGWEQRKLMTARNNPGKIFCQKKSPLCFCQADHNSCTFKSVKLPASLQISKHPLLPKHLKKPHTSYSSFLLLTSKAVSCNKTPSDISASFWACQNKTFRWLCLHCKHFFFHFVLWGKQMQWRELDFLSLGSLCCDISAHGCPWDNTTSISDSSSSIKIQTCQVSAAVSQRRLFEREISIMTRS